MTDEAKQKLIDSGMKDIVDTYELMQSGYAGVNKQGTIVDRRIDKDAVPIQKNSMFNTPEPKKIE